MSIATDEAEEKYPESRPFSTTWENNICRRTGYIAGRTAAPTFREIEEAAYALWKTDVNMAGLDPTDDEYTAAWLSLTNTQRDIYRKKATAVLEAARQEVMA
ncbi:MAG: hypothetical protein SOI13_01425 [Bifidobacterium mongoliense]|jgi:hypothetical protein|uniref:hypothetical protein n=1 Tax=Bifidobacterium mongoliense TaxID=518643 RepID=UPI002F35726C